MPNYMDEMIEKIKKKKRLAEQEAGEPKPVEPEEEKIPEIFSKEKKGEKEQKIFKKAEEPKPAQKTGAAETLTQGQVEEAREQEKDNRKKKLVTSYGNAKIYTVQGEFIPEYTTPVPRPTAAEKAIINTIKEAATRLITIAPFKIRDQQERRNVYYQKVIEILQNSPQLGIPQHRWEFYAESVVREMVGYGLIDPLVNDDKIEEIMVIGPKKPVYIFHRQYEMMTTNIEFYSDQEIIDLVNRIARLVGRRVDISSPMLDARLADGSRVNATVEPASVDGSTLTIRKFRKDPYSIIDLITSNTINTEVGAFLWLCVEGLNVKPANILISGGTGSGKTTSLNALAAFIPPYERIISIEDTAELNLPLKHWIRLEGKPPGLEGKGEITLDILTKNSLRMRPDRIIVGEIRHAEAFTFFTAINTGHSGCLGTIHANSPRETVVRVVSPPMNVPEVMLSGLDFILVEHRLHDKKKGTIRRVTEIAEVAGSLEGKTKTVAIFQYDPASDSISRTKNSSEYLKAVAIFSGKTVDSVEKEIKKREKFLKELIDNETHAMDKVTQMCLDFIDKEKPTG
ncbi:MAG: CpaF family protein [Candidatus Diapherotrites archaeon]|nr:CpaF family protein [Candidatus Diapherotrites archaeon]